MHHFGGDSLAVAGWPFINEPKQTSDQSSREDAKLANFTLVLRTLRAFASADLAIAA